MIDLSVRTTACDPHSEVDQVVGLSIPDWAEVPGIVLLSAVDYYEDALFNSLQLPTLALEVEAWAAYEQARGDPYSRRDVIAAVRRAIDVAQKRRIFVVFLGD